MILKLLLASICVVALIHQSNKSESKPMTEATRHEPSATVTELTKTRDLTFRTPIRPKPQYVVVCRHAGGGIVGGLGRDNDQKAQATTFSEREIPRPDSQGSPNNEKSLLTPTPQNPCENGQCHKKQPQRTQDRTPRVFGNGRSSTSSSDNCANRDLSAETPRQRRLSRQSGGLFHRIRSPNKSPGGLRARRNGHTQEEEQSSSHENAG